MDDGVYTMSSELTKVKKKVISCDTQNKHFQTYFLRLQKSRIRQFLLDLKANSFTINYRKLFQQYIFYNIELKEQTGVYTFSLIILSNNI